MIIQLNPIIPVRTPLGDGFAILVIDYGPHLNSCWCVALRATGEIKHFDANNVKMDKNWTYKIGTVCAPRQPDVD